jgi:putative ABC transport system permease protein
VYLSYKQVPDGGLPFYAPKDLLLRTSGEPLALAGAVREIVRGVDPALPVTDLRSMTEIVELETAARRTQIAVLVLFTAAAVILAATGIHGLLSFSVSQRSQEIGVRVALGATRAGVVRMILRDSLVLAATGTAIGLALAYYAGRAFESLLAGIHPTDFPTFITAAAIVALMALSGSLVPALRALSVDPATALRR